MKFWLKKRSLWSLSLLALLLTLIALFFILPPDFRWMGYQNNISGDTSQHIAGWYAFVHEPWCFPLLKINSLGYPAGGTVSLTDSIPLLALIFKLARNFLPAGFNYFGLFVVLIYFFQAFSALTLAYALKKNSVLGVAAFVVLSLTAPILSFRVGFEDSLACQGIILLGLSGYFFCYYKQLTLKGCHWFFGSLIFFSLLIHLLRATESEARARRPR